MLMWAGGSTEFTVYSKGKTRASRSFNLGTVRLLNDSVDEYLWTEVETWIKKHVENFKTINMIGSGGNINHIFRHSGQKRRHLLTYRYLESYYDMISSLSYEERVTQLYMRLDRADVILPATKIYLSAMKWSGAQHLYVPKIGLTNGMVKMMYYEDR